MFSSLQPIPDLNPNKEKLKHWLFFLEQLVLLWARSELSVGDLWSRVFLKVFFSPTSHCCRSDPLSSSAACLAEVLPTAQKVKAHLLPLLGPEVVIWAVASRDWRKKRMNNYVVWVTGTSYISIYIRRCLFFFSKFYLLYYLSTDIVSHSSDKEVFLWQILNLCMSQE